MSSIVYHEDKYETFISKPDFNKMESDINELQEELDSSKEIFISVLQSYSRTKNDIEEIENTLMDLYHEQSDIYRDLRDDTLRIHDIEDIMQKQANQYAKDKSRYDTINDYYKIGMIVLFITNIISLIIAIL